MAFTTRMRSVLHIQEGQAIWWLHMHRNVPSFCPSESPVVCARSSEQQQWTSFQSLIETYNTHYRERARLLCYLVLCVSRAVLPVVLGAWSVRFAGWADWVDCRCFLSIVFLGVARRLELSPCNTRTPPPPDFVIHWAQPGIAEIV